MQCLIKDLFHRWSLGQRLIAVIVVITFLSCDKEDESSLAEINSNIITLDSYLPRYKSFLSKTHQTDNLANRYALLNSLIDEELILEYAHKTAVINDPTVVREKQRIYDQLLLNQYFIYKIQPQTESTEQELRRLFTWSKTTMHVRHLFAPDLESINLLEDKLYQGAPWIELAKSSFSDPVLKDNGGDLGWISMGDMDPAFEVVAYNLKDTEISSPVKTRYGYSIIQVIEREKNLFLTEQDFQLEKDWLKLMATQYKKMPAIRSYTDSVEKALGINFNKDELKELFLAIIDKKETQKIYNNRPLVHFADGHFWTVKQTYEKVNDLSSRQFKRIHSLDNFADIISGLAVQEKFLHDAEVLNLSSNNIFTDLFEHHYHNYLIKLCIEKLYNNESLVNQNPDIVRSVYKDFRDGLADNATISIDSTVVKKFIFNLEISS